MHFWGNFAFLGKISFKNWLRNIVALIAGIEKKIFAGGWQWRRPPSSILDLATH